MVATTLSPRNRNSLLNISLLLILSTLSFFCFSPLLAESLHPISDVQVRQNKLQCYADIDSGLWGWQCKSSMIARENCALRCLSPACYELIYESDPLEEGEKDFIRSQEYKYCMHNCHGRLRWRIFCQLLWPICEGWRYHSGRLSLGESIEGVKGSFGH